MLIIKPGGIKYHFFFFFFSSRLWYDSTWDWTLVSSTIGEHHNPYANGNFFFLNECIGVCSRAVSHLFIKNSNVLFKKKKD